MLVKVRLFVPLTTYSSKEFHDRCVLAVMTCEEGSWANTGLRQQPLVLQPCAGAKGGLSCPAVSQRPVAPWVHLC